MADFLQANLLNLLTIASVGLWFWLLSKPRRFFDLLAKAADRQFIKNPVGDYGLMVLMFAAIIGLLGMVNIEKQFPNKPTKPDQPAASANAGQVLANINGLQESRKSPPAADQEKKRTDDRSDETEEVVASDSDSLHESPKKSEETEPKELTVQDVEKRSRKYSYLYLWQILCCVLLVFMGRTLYQMPLFKVGLGPMVDGKFTGTLLVGVVGFLALVPIVIWIHTGLSLLLNQGYEHSTLSHFDVMKMNHRWDLIAICYLQTAVGAALFEEFVFRGVFQGFAERCLRWRNNAPPILLGPLQTPIAKAFGIEPLTLETSHPSFKKKQPRAPIGSLRFWGPIIASSIAFALMHVGQGAAPIALYLLAMGLGFIYKVTGNLSVCIIIHFLLNALTLTDALTRSSS